KTFRINKAKKFDFITEDGTHIHLTEEQINKQKKIEEKAKAEATKRKSKDFVTIEDLKYFSNTMMYIVQEIFFRRHQGPGLDDYARTFSSLLLAKVDKRNLNTLKQMRFIEQLSARNDLESVLGVLVLSRVLRCRYYSMFSDAWQSQNPWRTFRYDVDFDTQLY
nr:hypothetical protein [Tanacetum cinerariifolium]